ncbi:MAG: alpha/beta hydrolase [Proteobacteria bacterium]|jgi:pimeloyl-ACP methyl ester carboxylesterase|nr:alpha/beta hydrolase [Pseudomonadota bacterium]
MGHFQAGDVTLHYEIYGEGTPVLLFAPGGMRSAISFWDSSPWNPITALASDFQVIAMDQRNAGTSLAPIEADHNWDTYTDDHLALLDHLQVERCHILGGCIGGAFAFNLLKRAPERVIAAVIQQSIGLDNNRQAFYDMFDGWASEQQLNQPPLTKAILRQFRSNLYDQDFVFSATEAEVLSCQHPLLVLMGQDLYHPESISRGISAAPQAVLIEDWKDDPGATAGQVIGFLKSHSHI